MVAAPRAEESSVRSRWGGDSPDVAAFVARESTCISNQCGLNSYVANKHTTCEVAVTFNSYTANLCVAL